MEFEIGDRIKHKHYGKGTIIPDTEGTCYRNERIVRFDEWLGIYVFENGKRTKAYTEIIYCNEMELL